MRELYRRQVLAVMLSPDYDPETVLKILDNTPPHETIEGLTDYFGGTPAEKVLEMVDDFASLLMKWNIEFTDTELRFLDYAVDLERNADKCEEDPELTVSATLSFTEIVQLKSKIAKKRNILKLL